MGALFPNKDEKVQIELKRLGKLLRKVEADVNGLGHSINGLGQHQATVDQRVKVLAESVDQLASRLVTLSARVGVLEATSAPSTGGPDSDWPWPPPSG